MYRSGRSPTTVRKFRRDFFVASMLPLLGFLFFCLVGVNVARDHVANLLADSTSELNQNAEHSLQMLGESIIRQKARDVAKQLAIYLRLHPRKSLSELRLDPQFMELAIQTVGETGYTAVSEAAETRRILIHPNPSLVDQDMGRFAEAMPSWWKIARAGLSGDESSGYYDWLEPDESLRQKFLVTTPVGVPVDGITLMVSATAYIDEFSAPIVQMKKRAETIDSQYQAYVSRQTAVFMTACALLLLSALAGTYLFGARAARRFIEPVGQLAEVVREFGAGRWSTKGLDPIAHRDDEIGILARTFQRLSSQIVDLFNRLDQRVSTLQRTQAALEDSEDHYRKLYETAKETEAIYRSLIHSSADAIVMLDMELLVTYLSPTFTRIFGWTQDELMGEIIPYIVEEEKESTLQILHQVLVDGISFQGYETKRLTKQGDVIDVSVSASRFADHEGRPKGVLAIVRDISEKRRVEAEMQRLGRLESIGTLAGGVAHDFNNLLTVIQSNVSILKSEIPESFEDYPSLLEIEEQIQSGASLTRQLLGFARKGRYEVRVADLNETVEKVANTICRTRKDVVLRLDLTADLQPVAADFHQIEQVLLNLYINACDAMPEGGELSVSTANVVEAHGPMVMLSVRDTGGGMDPEIMDRIFDPFFTTKEIGRGTGLGLASAFGIIESHGGRIDVCSEPGTGTTFRIFLPATQHEESDFRASPEQASRGQGTILIVDDEALVLKACARVVRSLGYEVLTASGGHEGIEIYREQGAQIDLVILDMIMPGMNGRRVFEELKTIDPDVAVVISSGYSIDGRETEALSAECRGQIQKPYTIEELAERLALALGSDEPM